MGDTQEPRSLSDRLAAIKDKLTDPYWRLDHPEVTAILLGTITGLIGILFAWIRIRLIERPAQ